MAKERKAFLFFVACFAFFAALPLFAGDLGMTRSGFSGTPPPRLLYPITDKVDLSGKDSLEFRWWNNFGIDHYEFRLFKGYNMYAPDQLDKKILPSKISSIAVKADVFEDGQVYSWSLIAVSYGGQKSDKSFSSFRVIKA